MTIKIVDTVTAPERIVPMYNMKPMQIGQVVEEQYKGDYVMRTQTQDCSEVMNLSNPGIGNCWLGNYPLKVRLLLPGETITIELSNP